MRTSPANLNSDALQHYIRKIELAARGYTTVTLRYIKDGDYWHAYADSEDTEGRTRTVASATADGEVTCLDRLALQLGVSFPEPLTASVVAGAVNLLDAMEAA